MKTFIHIALFLALTTTGLLAQDASQIQQRMKDRLPTIVSLKEQKIVGENNEAYLSTLGSVTTDQAKVIQNENADRKTVYSLLAKQTGTTIDFVEKKRAEQLRAQAIPGTMIQLENGEWVEKK